MNNVINLQAAKERLAKVDEEEFVYDAFGDDHDAIGEFALMVSFDIVDALSDMGVNVQNDPKTFKDILTVIEAIKGLIFRAKLEPYTWHKVSDHLGSFEDEELPNLLDEYLRNLVDSSE